MIHEVKSSSNIYGKINIVVKSATRITIKCITGDQQAALYGRMCVEK